MANDENLKPPFKKGQSGNPNGRPKGSRNRSTIIRELLEQAALKKVQKIQSELLIDEDGKEIPQQTIADQVAAALLIKALSGDVSAARELLDSSYGKLTEKIDNSHSISRMGSVTAQISDASGDERAQELTFDVGEEAQDMETEEE